MNSKWQRMRFRRIFFFFFFVRNHGVQSWEWEVAPLASGGGNVEASGRSRDGLERLKTGAKAEERRGVSLPGFGKVEIDEVMVRKLAEESGNGDAPCLNCCGLRCAPMALRAAKGRMVWKRSAKLNREGEERGGKDRKWCEAEKKNGGMPGCKREETITPLGENGRRYNLSD